MLAVRQLPPSDTEADKARDSMRLLSRYAHDAQSLTVRITEGGQSDTIVLPAAAVALLMDILKAMAAGQGITVIPQQVELTTVQAADILNVSRPFLIRLLDDGDIPYRMVGKHRRIRMQDVMAYKQTIDQKREAILDQLAADAQAQDMGYD